MGGGPSTLYLMRQELVTKRRWLTERQFLEDWAFSKLSLGINLIALAALISGRLFGVRGIAVSLAAMVVPSAVITAVMTAAYAGVRDEPLIRAALAGAGPVTAGMTVGIAYTFGRQAVRRGWRGAIDWTYGVVVVAVGLFTTLTPIVIIGAGVLVGVTLLRGEPSRAAGDPGT